jgi:hypothetical protein
LARAAAEWLHEAHLRLALAEDPNDSRPPSEIIDSFARDQYVSTLKIAGLLERGEDNNQVIDALKPQDFETLWIEAKNDAERLATQGIGSMNSIQWAARLDETLPMVATQFGDAHDVGVREKAKVWTEKMPERILSVATDLARRFGIRVAARTLELVAEEMIQNAEELEDEANQFESQSDRSTMRATVLAELPPSGNFPGSHPGVSKAVEHGLWCTAGYLSEAKKRRIASQLLIEMANGFVAPLAAGLGRSYEELNLRGFVGEGNRAPIVERWPQVSVPDSLVPPPNEFLVIEIDEFVDTFDRLIQRSTKSTNKHDCFNEARGEIITGGFLDTDAVAVEIAKPIQILQKWSPSPSLLIGANSDKSNATFQFNFDAMSLFERAQAWISRPGTSLEKFINADLRGFLTESNECSVQEMSARQSRFQSAFSAALDASEPLVDVDEHLRSIVHGGARHRRIVTSTLPFKNHSLEGHVRSILHSRLGAEEGSRVSEQISDTSIARGIKSIAISSHLGAPHDPIVFRSVTTPMIVGWASAQGSASAVGFWKYRRARPIREFVPVSQEVLVCMTRGWFTARLLGLVDWSTRQISDPDRPTPAKFPSRLLTEPSTHRDWLPALLESIMLANCEAANLGDVESLRAYVRLRNLGAQPGTTDFHQSHSYRRLNESLEGWLTTGEATGALVEGILVKAAKEELGQRPTAGARSELLKAKLQETFDSYKNDYRSYLAEASHSPERLGANFELWPGMADVILAGLEDLIQAASRHQAASSELM